MSAPCGSGWAAARAEAAALLGSARRQRNDDDARSRQDRQSAEAQQSLRRLTGQLEDVLHSVGTSVPPDLVVVSDDRHPVAS